MRVDQAAGSYAPPGANTAGSSVTLVEKDGTGATLSTRQCATVADPAPSPGSSCAGTYAVAAGDTLTLTQTSAAAHFVAGDPQTIGPYQCTVIPVPPFIDTCSSGPVPVTATIRDKGLPPTVTDASTTVTVPENTASNVNVDEQQINTDGASPTAVDVTTEPAHGTVVVVSDAPPVVVAAAVTTPVTGAFHFVYTPTHGYIGPDTFQYTVTTVNGTSGTATVDLRVVGHAPTLRDDSASTKHGVAVIEDVLANDNANGGGTLVLDAVSSPRHGNAEIVNGKVRYMPVASFSGTDRFTYTASTYSG
ncbi:MAG TPA: Ig-like domain-containing protein, partial [Jatrophihabitans sp.]|nr:Ig-like domain-containing protein [Jatrophihabitans sp.]